MARVRSPFTVSEFGTRRVVHARGVADLARQLADITCWTHVWCHEVATKLYQGQAFVALDFETIIVPGDLPFWEARPDEDPKRTRKLVEAWAL